MNSSIVYLDHSVLLALLGTDTNPVEPIISKLSNELKVGQIKPVTSIISIEKCFDILQNHSVHIDDTDIILDSIMKLCNLFTIDQKIISRCLRVMKSHDLKFLYSITVSICMESHISAMCTIVPDRYPILPELDLYQL